jgi:hypothetical protein
MTIDESFDHDNVCPFKIDDAVAMGKREIQLDIDKGIVPADIDGFGKLHDFVDANEYGGLTTKYGDADTAFAVKVQDRLNDWLMSGRTEEAKRTILVHLNIELAATAPEQADDVAREISDCIRLALDDEACADHVPALAGGEWCIPLAEEV